ncbi:LIP-domain-containing protein [Viridothelium virens]|uniref:LIP-domain-containing protein n=1 Tax=Viridothelium virens TaxID=1048519 RepID=A0A6A6HE18_VIRVR|nr:LIP-domain-containing protein [Viridothelium virens]
MHLSRSLLSLHLVAAAAAAAVLLPTSPSLSQPIPPSQDAWYTAPSGWNGSAPGTILRIRQAPGNLTSEAQIANASAAYNILYRTTDSHFQPSWAVTTLFIPKTEYLSPSGRLALLSFQFAYDSADVDSSPSYGIYNDLAVTVPSLGVPSQTATINLALGNGWFVQTPDFEGPQAAFGAVVQEGHATLDAQRAVLSLAKTVLAVEPDKVTVALWGYSGGSVATAAAAELQVQYAPELTLAGAASGGLVTNLSTTLDGFNGSAIAGDLVSSVLGLMAEYPAADAYIRSRLVPATAAKFLGTYNRTLLNATAYWDNVDVYSYFIGGREDLFNSSVMKKIFAYDTVLGVYGVPTTPLYFYKAVGDEYCPVRETDALVNQYSATNPDITYQRNTVGGHVDELINGQPGAFEWLWGIFNESHIPLAACSIQNVTVNISSTNS